MVSLEDFNVVVGRQSRGGPAGQGKEEIGGERHVGRDEDRQPLARAAELRHAGGIETGDPDDQRCSCVRHGRQIVAERIRQREIDGDRGVRERLIASAVTCTATGPVWATSPASRPSAALVEDARAPESTKSADSRIARTRQRPIRPLIPSIATFVMSAAHPAEKLLARLRATTAGADCGSCRQRQGDFELARSRSFCSAFRSTGRLDHDTAEEIASSPRRAPA